MTVGAERGAARRRTRGILWLVLGAALVSGAAVYLVLRPSREERITRQLAAARRALDQQDYGRAERLLRKAIRSAPDNGVLQHNLAVLYARQNRIAEARTAFEAAARAHGPAAQEVRAEEYFQLASLSVAERKWDQAAGELQQAIAAHPGRALLYARLLDLQLGALEQPAAADSTLVRYLAACGRSPENLVAAGHVYFQNRGYARAADLAREALAAADTSVEARALLATALARSARGPEALRLLDDGIARRPGDATLWIARASVDMFLELRPEALRDTERAVQIAPQDFEARLLHVQALGGLGRLDDALAAIESARPTAMNPAAQRALLIEQRNLRRAREMQRGLDAGRAAAGDSAAAAP